MMKKISLIVFYFSLAYFMFSSAQLYKKAVELETAGQLSQAVAYYKQFLSQSKNKTVFDQIQLKIARLTSSNDQKVNEYQKFFDRYPKSRYRYIARYELSHYYHISQQPRTALKQLNLLINESKGTPYWQKAVLKAAVIEHQLSHHQQASLYLYRILQEIDDYEDIGTAYFLLGSLLAEQKSLEEAEEYYLICAGSFARSSKAPAALLQLMHLYFQAARFSEALGVMEIMKKEYSHSADYQAAQKLALKIASHTRKKTVALINLNQAEQKKDEILNQLRKDLKLSDRILDQPKSTPQAAGYYAQLGYYSSSQYAKQFIEKCKTEKGLNGLGVIEVSSSPGKIHYRVVLGPFQSRQQINKKLIELKDKNIEAMLLEYNNNYE